MKIGGSVLMDKNGSFDHVKPHDAQHAICGFASMVQTADYCKDSLYYEGEEWADFYARGYEYKEDLWKEAGQIAYTILFMQSNPIFINNLDEYNARPEPKISGGFEYEGCPENYVYDKDSIETWHDNWLYNHPEKIDWSKSNDIFPRYDKALEVLRKELQKLKGNPDFISGLEHLEKQYIASVDIDKLSAQEVVSKFYSLIMDHKAESGERISYAKEIGSKICELNYYHHEQELEDLNKCNQQIVKIYSIKRDDKYQFLSIDKRHGRFELCDDNGDHLCELMFDGTKVENSQEANHSILHISDWKRTYHK